MKCDANLSEFNRRFAKAMLSTFLADVKAVQAQDGTLLFRGPIPLANDQTYIGTHVAVSLDREVTAALSGASPLEREAMMEILISNLGARVRAQYDPSKIGSFALDVVGTMHIICG